MKIENLNRERLAQSSLDYNSVYTNRLSVSLSSSNLHSSVNTQEAPRLASVPRAMSRGPSLKVPTGRTRPFMRKREGKETSGRKNS